MHGTGYDTRLMGVVTISNFTPVAITGFSNLVMAACGSRVVFIPAPTVCHTTRHTPSRHACPVAASLHGSLGCVWVDVSGAQMVLFCISRTGCKVG